MHSLLNWTSSSLNFSASKNPTVFLFSSVNTSTTCPSGLSGADLDVKNNFLACNSNIWWFPYILIKLIKHTFEEKSTGGPGKWQSSGEVWQSTCVRLWLCCTPFKQLKSGSPSARKNFYKVETISLRNSYVKLMYDWTSLNLKCIGLCETSIWNY